MAVYQFFKDGGRPTSWIFKFYILTASPLGRTTMRHLAKFRAEPSNISADMAVFLFFKMPSFHHLGFLKVRNSNC